MFIVAVLRCLYSSAGLKWTGEEKVSMYMCMESQGRWSAVQDFLVVHPFGGGSFSVHKDGLSLSVFQFSSVFQKCLVSAGYDPTGYSSHSFRIEAVLGYMFAPIWYR